MGELGPRLLWFAAWCLELCQLSDHFYSSLAASLDRASFAIICLACVQLHSPLVAAGSAMLGCTSHLALVVIT